MSELIGVLITFLPLILILLLANAAERAREREQEGTAFAVFAYALLIFTYLGLMLFGLIMLLAGTLADTNPAAFGDAVAMMPAMANMNTDLLGYGLLATSLVGLLLLLRPVRRALAGIVPIDPLSTVHAVALSFSMLIIVQLVLILGIGLDVVADMLVETQEQTGQAPTSLLGLWLQQATMAIMAMIGVGWLVRRPFGESLKRLGVVVPTVRQVLLGIGMALVMVGVVIAIEVVATSLGFGFDEDVEQLSEQLLGGMFTSIPGVLTLGLAAALGEEPLMRGAAQPRFGLVLTSILFALLHSNYGITLSTAVVVLLGLVLGWLRMRHNTSTAMVMHAVYNITLGLMGYFAIDFLSH